MQDATIYTMDSCPYCVAAKRLLTERGVAFREVSLPLNDEALWEALARRSGMKTVPQIFLGEDLIGGFTDLAKLDRENGLKDFPKTAA